MSGSPLADRLVGLITKYDEQCVHYRTRANSAPSPIQRSIAEGMGEVYSRVVHDLRLLAVSVEKGE